MNKNWLNNKFNILYLDKGEFPIQSPKNCILYFGDIKQTGFDIKKYELEKDEVFSGNLIIKNKTILDEYNLQSILDLPLDDNCIYVKNYVNSPHAMKCSVDDSILYCGSFVFWLLSNFKDNHSLYAHLRRHRILLKRIGDYL